MLIVMGLATIRTITPLAKVENHNLASYLLVASTVTAYVVLINHFVSLNVL